MEYIKTIPSDSTIKNIEIKNDSITIYFDFDVEMNGKLETKVVFEEVAAFQMFSGWNKDINVEGLGITNDSDFLHRTKKMHQEEGIPEIYLSQFKSFQIVSSNLNPVTVEIIAQSFKIE